MRVAAAAYGDIDGWQILPVVGQAEAESELLYHCFNLLGRIDLKRFFPPPLSISIELDFLGNAFHFLGKRISLSTKKAGSL